MNPIDFGVSILAGVIGLVIGVPLGTRIMSKYMFSPQKIMEMADSFMDYAVNTLEGQQKIGKFMTVISSGVAKGIMPAGNRKMSLKDMIISIGFGYAQQHGLIPGFNQQPQQQQQLPENQNQNNGSGDKPFG